MASDIKLFQDKVTTLWDIDFENGDFALTEGLDTAIYMSVLCQVRALESQVFNPILRSGHFTNEFSDVEGYEIGSLLWHYSQSPNTEENRGLIVDTISDGLAWMIDDNIIKDVDVELTYTATTLQIDVRLTGKNQEESTYNLSFLSTFR